jgi:hypothetical protein
MTVSSRVRHPLLLEDAPDRGAATASSALLQDLVDLAFAHDSVVERSHALFQMLKKKLGQPTLCETLLGLQHLARRGEAAGARLLAALLDANTTGAKLVPLIHTFASARRLVLDEAHGGASSDVLRGWQRRLTEAERLCEERRSVMPEMPAWQADRPGNEPPFPLFRRCLRHIVAQLYRDDRLDDDDRQLLIRLASLETDAYAERISRLTGTVDPFRVAAVGHLLPRLSRADVEIRDLRQFINWLEKGEVDRAFHERQPRQAEVMDPDERKAFAQQVAAEPALAALSGILANLAANPLPVSRLAIAATRLLALGHGLRALGVRRDELTLLQAVALAQGQDDLGDLRLPLDRGLHELVGRVLESEPGDEGLDGWPRDGFRLEVDALVLEVAKVDLGVRHQTHDLPAPAPQRAARDEDDPEQPKENEMTPFQLKELVLANIGTVSVVLGFLRNPRIVSIPGLVAAVVVRTRSLAVLEAVANNRTLYSGFANKDVPRCLVCHPCNIPVKTLRKFIHVKYISRVDLRRLVKDKTGIRPEILKEIEDYLKTLG